MNKFVKTGSRTGIVLSLTAVALVAPQVILAGPGCMNNQRMSPGYYPYSPMEPQMTYGQTAPYSYYPAAAPYAGYNRDPAVTAWVLQEADGQCESCGGGAPFIREDGTPFLEVHHVHRLADGGPDTIENAIAICPNCHREFHYGASRDALIDGIYSKISRLVKS